jgi:peptidoglycan/LPS O-acetylase OafA/YrhL
LAWLSYIYVEQPGIRLGKIVLARWRNPVIPTAVPLTPM